MSVAGRATEIPLCVDLDGTLVRTDTLVESLLVLVRRRPSRLPLLPWWLIRGRAHAKRRVAEHVSPDPAGLPYDPTLLAELRRERDGGRRLILVTASHERTARRVAEHLALFDEVLATDGQTNLKGEAKRRVLVERFGEGGFDYAGDSRADLAVWSSARHAIAVNAPRSVVRRLGGEARVLDSRTSRIAAVIRAMRVRQWVKNLLLVLPAVLAHRYGDPAILLSAGLAFLSFSLGASAIYLLNDLLDLDADRDHPVKRHRPFASGALPLELGLILSPLLAIASLALGAALGGPYLLCLGGYLVLTVLYSMWLKQIALVDVMVLAGLFTLRILAGGAATRITVSEWLLALSMFLFVSLGAVKRYAELRRLARTAGAEPEDGPRSARGRGYTTADLAVMMPLGLASGYIAVLVMALYVTSDAVVQWYRRPVLLWLVCPLLLYWISRIWLLAQRDRMDEDPVLFAVRDGVTWVIAALCAAIVLAAHLT